MLYYYPNRPSLIPPDKDYIYQLEKSGEWIAEQKWNGDNTLIYTGANDFWNRHKQRLRYKPTPQVTKELERIPGNGLINAETVHYHTKTVKNLIIVHCVLVWKGQPLFGKSWQDSRDILETLQYGEHVVLSKIWTEGFWDLFEQADGDIIEGIVLKKRSGLIRLSTSPIPDVSWMLKVRKPSKKYAF